MDKLSFGNLTTNTQNISPQMQQRLESGENFTAIDKEKLKQDTVEITQNAVKENFVFKILRNTFGVKDPKKFLTSLGLTTVTVIGFATAGNMSVKKMTQLGLNVDEILGKNGLYQSITSFFKKGTDGIGNFFKKFKTVNDVVDTLKNKMVKPIQQFAKGTGQGIKIQFAYTIPDVLEALPLKAQGDTYKNLRKALGSKGKAIKFITAAAQEGADQAQLTKQLADRIGDSAKAKQLMDDVFTKNENLHKSLEKLLGPKADEYYKHCMNADRSDVKGLVENLTKDIAQNILGENYTKADLSELLMALKDGKTYKGVDFSEFNDVTMNREGLIGSWWPYNIINSVAKKFNGNKDLRFTKGSLGDALLKYNMAAGNCADTTLGKITQNLLLVPGESISNFCCDAAGMNFFLLPMIFDLFNTAQDAPKGQKAATVANDFVGSIGSLMVTMPLASAATYGLASLKNIDPKTSTKFSKYILKPLGNFFGMGLDAAKNANIKDLKWSGNTLKKLGNMGARWGGGFMRLIMIMFLFQPLFNKPIQAAIQKIFGKPYDKDEAAKTAELEAQKQQVVPELGITQGELMDKIQKNPQALQKLQTDPKLAQTIQQNPKTLLDLLDNKEVQYIEPKPTPASKGQILSPANKGKIGNSTNVSTNSTQKTKTPNEAQTTKTTNNNVDTATYIPSSAFVAPNSSLSQEQLNEYNAMMTKADKALKRAEQYI